MATPQAIEAGAISAPDVYHDLLMKESALLCASVFRIGEAIKMQWYWIALVLGSVVAPWVMQAQTLKVAFLRSVTDGLGVWFGVALLTTPLVFAATWLGVNLLL